MNRKGRYILVLVTAIGCSLLLTFKQSEPLWIGFVNSLFFVALAIFCFGIIGLLLQKGAYHLTITSFRRFFKPSGKLGEYILERDEGEMQNHKTSQLLFPQILVNSGGCLLLLSCLASIYFLG